MSAEEPLSARGIGGALAPLLSRTVGPAFRILALCLVAVVLMKNRFIFFPSPGTEELPTGVAQHWFTTSDGVKLHALFLKAPGPAPLLLWSHGNAGNISQRAFLLPMMAVHGLSVLAYDYRGYGLSAGSPSEDGVALDALAAYALARSLGYPDTQIILFGESLGGAVSIQLATQHPCAGLVLSSTFTRIRDVGWHHYGPLALVMGNAFNSAARLPSIHVPLIMFHGDADELIPHSIGEQLFATANPPKQFLTIAGGTHDDVLLHEEFLGPLAAFSRSVTQYK